LLNRLRKKLSISTLPPNWHSKNYFELSHVWNIIPTSLKTPFTSVDGKVKNQLMTIDAIDKKILDVLQADASSSLQKISEIVSLSTTPCWRRIQRLENEGYILQRVALLSAEKLNVGVTVFVSIRTSNHDEKWFAKFSSVITSIPQIVEFYRMSGDVDYLLRVVVPDIKGYDAVYKRIIRDIEITDVSSSFAMEQIKFTTALPLEYA
jgi:Lrp/AsnC family transcriptional regulator